MDWKDLLIENYDSALKVLERALHGLTPDNLNWQPRPDCNSIGWITWHLTRSLDSIMSSINGKEELWIEGKWYDKFNRPPDPSDNGYGHTPEQLASFNCPDTDTLLDYHKAVLASSKEYLSTVSSSDLNRTVDDFLSQFFPTIGSRLVVAVDELLQHAGQVAYVRGLIHGKGWQEF